MIRNSKEKIYVAKKFIDKELNEMEAVDGSWSFGIYTKPLGSNNNKLLQVLTITYQNGVVTYTLDGDEVDEPAFTCAEINTAYYVYELNTKQNPIANEKSFEADGQIYEVSYTSAYDNPNKVVAHEGYSTIIVTNKMTTVDLAMTGGIGDNYNRIAYAVLAFLLVGLAFVNHKRKKEQN